MSFLLNDSATAPHSLDMETLPGTSVEMFNHGVKAIREGGAIPYRNLDVGTTGVLVDMVPMQIYGGKVFNGHATALRYLKLYDTATVPTASDTPVRTIPLVAQKESDLNEVVGLTFFNGIGLRATTGIADTDTGAPSTNDVVVNLSCTGRAAFVSGVVGNTAATGWTTAPVITG